MQPAPGIGSDAGRPLMSEAPSVALTFLFAGLAYALPTLLFRENHPLHGPVSSEILNLHFLVAWMGLAHFVFAYTGQAKALRKQERSAIGLFVGGLAGAALLLLVLRQFIPANIFDFLIWVYFVPHLVKAELHFNGAAEKPAGWVVYWFPALCFGFLTFALFGPKALSLQTELLIVPAILCVFAGIGGGVMQQLYTPNAKYALLAFFFIGEALVWGTYAKYMTPQFRQGVYVFHIAAASFYHYFRAYSFALRKGGSARELSRGVLAFAAVNITLVVLGILAMHSGNRVLDAVFDIRNFTFWVGLHLVASDLCSLSRRWKKLP